MRVLLRDSRADDSTGGRAGCSDKRSWNRLETSNAIPESLNVARLRTAKVTTSIVAAVSVPIERKKIDFAPPTGRTYALMWYTL